MLATTSTSTAVEVKRSRMDRRTRELLEQHIGLEAIIEALEFAVATAAEGYDYPAGGEQPKPANPKLLVTPVMRYRALLERLTDEEMAPPKSIITQLMAECGVKVPELLSLLTPRNIALALVRTQHRVVEVLDGLGEAAVPKDVACPHCNRGVLSSTGDEGQPMSIDCPHCNATGKVRVMGDLDAAKLFLAAQGVSTGSKPASGSAANIINVGAQAIVRNGRQSADEREPVTVRVQKIIDG